MTVVNPKSISGITSITTASGSDNLLTIHTSDANNTERLRIDSTGATKIVTGIVTTLTATTGIVTTLTANTVTSLGAVSGTTGTFSGDIKTTAATVNVKSGTSINTNSDTSAHGALHKNTNSGEFAVVSGGTGGNNHLTFYTSASAAPTEKVRIDSSGRLLKSGQASLTSTSLNHPIQVAAASDATAIAIIGRAADDIGELNFYEADKSTNLGEIQYRQDHANIRHRVGDIRFATGGTTERMRINSSGQVLIGADTQGSADGYVNNFMIAETGGNAGMSIQSYNSASSYTTIALGDRTTHNRGYIEQRCGDNNQMTIGLNGNGSFRFIGKNSGGSVAERIRITYDGITFNGDTAAANALDDYEEGTWTPVPILTYNPGGRSITAGTSEGIYVKIGRFVHVEYKVQWTGIPGSGAYNVGASGLPYAADATVHVVSGTARSNQTGYTFVAEGLSGSQINVFRRYDNGSPNNVDIMYGFATYQTT